MNRIIWIFMLLTYGITWSILLIGGFLLHQNFITKFQFDILFLFGALGPFIGAFATARIFYGQPGVKKLLATFSFKGGNSASWLLIGSPWLLFLLGLLAYRMITGDWFTFAVTQSQFKLDSDEAYFAWLAPFIIYAFFEEAGWRGFLLPHLQEKHTAFRATVLLTLIWGAWHIPMFWLRFHFTIWMALGFCFGLLVGAIILTTVFNQSSGSLWAAIFFHLNNNLASAFEQQYIVAVLSVGFVLLALYLLSRYGAMNLSDRQRVKNFYQPKQV